MALVALLCVFAVGVLLGALLRASLRPDYKYSGRQAPKDLQPPTGAINVLLVGPAPKLAAVCSLALAVYLTRTIASPTLLYVKLLFVWFFLWMCLFYFLRAAAWGFGFSPSRNQRDVRPPNSAVRQLVAEITPLSAFLIGLPILLFLLPLVPGVSAIFIRNNPVFIMAYSGVGFGVLLFLFVLGLSLVGLSWDPSCLQEIDGNLILAHRLRKVVGFELFLSSALFLTALSNVLSLGWSTLIILYGAIVFLMLGVLLAGVYLGVIHDRVLRR